MNAAGISVHKLRLRADRQASAPALRARIEDGLRVSTLPPALAHRFVLVRKLRLTLPREASAQSLALQLQREWRAIESLAQPLASAPAEADAVWAADEAEARRLLVRRWLGEQDTEAWFWRRLLSAARPSMPLAERLVLALSADFDAAGGLPPGVRSAEAGFRRDAWREIAAAGQGPAVLAQSQAPLRAALMALQGDAAEVHAPPWTVAHTAARLTDIVGAPPGRARATAPGTTAPLLPRSPTESEAEMPGGVRPPDDPPANADPAWVATLTRVTPTAAVAAAPATADPTRAVPRAGSPRSLCDGQTWAQSAATAWAGLWFLLPLLQRLGLEDEPDPAALLAAVLRHAATRWPVDAPAGAWVEQVAARAAVPAVPVAPQAQAWWRRARIACAQQTRLPLRRLLHRAGQVWLSPQRADVMLPLARADVRIRRAGWDIDPGYVPWLDCVIHFHYR
jgi:hypothetical protein